MKVVAADADERGERRERGDVRHIKIIKVS